MSPDTVLRRRKRPGVGPLLPVFLRTRGSAWSSVASAFAALLIVTLHAVTQGIVMSPQQESEEYFGDFDHVWSNALTVRLGEQLPPSSLEEALREAGAHLVGVRTYVIELGGTEDPAFGGLRYEEVDLAAPVRTDTTRLVEGDLPSSTGQVCLSPRAAEHIAGAAALSFYAGSLELVPRCVAINDHHRDEAAIYAFPGTWDAAGREIDPASAQRWNAKASVNVYWTGGEVNAVGTALSRVVAQHSSGSADPPTAEAAFTPVESATEMRARERGFNSVNNLWVFLIPLFLVPFIAGSVSSWVGARLLSRSVSTLRALGLRRRQTRLLTTVIPLVASLAGTTVGVALGVGAGWAARSVLGWSISHPLGPWVGLPVVVGAILLATAVGVVVGVGLARARLGARVQTDLAWARIPRIPWPSTAFLIGSITLLVIGAALTLGGRSTSTRHVAAVVLVGTACVLVIPLVVGLGSRRGLAASARGLLTSRMLTQAGGAWLVMILFGLQAVVTTGALTQVTSSVASANDSLVTEVPTDQVRLQTIGLAPAVGARLAEDVGGSLGTVDSFSFRFTEEYARAADGAMYVVDTAQEAASLMGVSALDPSTRAAAESGAALRGVPTQGGEVALVDPGAPDPESADAVIARASTIEVPGVTGDLAGGGYVLLAESARSLGLTTTPVAGYAFPGLSPAQMERAERLPTVLEFDPYLLDLPEAPDTFEVPSQVTAGAAFLAGVGVVLALLYGLQAGAAARPVLAGAQAVGLRRGWVRAVLARQVGWVVLAPTMAGLIGSAIGVWSVALAEDIPVQVHVPWPVVGSLAAGTAIAYGGAVFLALRGMSTRERIV